MNDYKSLAKKKIPEKIMMFIYTPVSNNFGPGFTIDSMVKTVAYMPKNIQGRYIVEPYNAPALYIGFTNVASTSPGEKIDGFNVDGEILSTDTTSIKTIWNLDYSIGTPDFSVINKDTEVNINIVNSGYDYQFKISIPLETLDITEIYDSYGKDIKSTFSVVTKCLTPINLVISSES